MPALRIRLGFVVNPLIRGFLYMVRMPSKSAPSAKIFTASWFSRSIPSPLRPSQTKPARDQGRAASRFAQYDLRRLPHRGSDEIRTVRLLVRIAQVDKDRPATDGLPGRDVGPPIADHKASRTVEPQPASGAAQHARSRFAAVAFIASAVVARLDGIDRERCGEA